MNILVYHGKHGDEYFLADTDERLNAALRELFDRLDEHGCYSDEDRLIVADARKGNPKDIRLLLECHRGYEYEDWDLEEAIDVS